MKMTCPALHMERHGKSVNPRGRPRKSLHLGDVSPSPFRTCTAKRWWGGPFTIHTGNVRVEAYTRCTASCKPSTCTRRQASRLLLRWQDNADRHHHIVGHGTTMRCHGLR